MAPAVFDDTLYVSTVPGNTKSFYKGNGAGVLWALDADTGKERWTFWTVPEDLWSASTRRSTAAAASGIRRPSTTTATSTSMSRTPRRGPARTSFPWGSSRPGPNLDTNSSSSSTARTARSIWQHQVLAHDVYDWDLQLPPVLSMTATGRSRSRPASWATSTPWTRRAARSCGSAPVGQHNGHDKDNELALQGNYDQMPKLPLTLLPGILGGVETQMAVAAASSTRRS